MYNTHWQIIDIHESFSSLSILIIAQLSADNTIMDHAKEKNMEKLINNAPFALVLVFLVIGFVLLIKGADFFVEGSSSVAKRLHRSYHRSNGNLSPRDSGQCIGFYHRQQ